MTEAEWSYTSAMLSRAPLEGLAKAERSIGPFEVEAELGRGGMGQVFRVRYRGRRYALKILLDDNEVARKRLEREAELVGALEHPGIVRLEGMGRVDGRPFLLYELVPGARTLDVAWEGLGLAPRIRLVAQVAEAVGFAHTHGVVHRDLKPTNVLVDDRGQPRVIDFGLAAHERSQRLTRTGAWVGTPTYMAREQFAGDAGALRPQVDVWALGVLLYEALTERKPFASKSVVCLIGALERGVVEPPRVHCRQVHPAIEAVCLRALRRNPDRRHPDAASFARELRAALAQAPAARRAGPVARGLAASGVVLALGVVAVGLWPEPTAPAAVERVDLRDPLARVNLDFEPEELLVLARERLALAPGDLEGRLAEGVALMELRDFEGAVLLAGGISRDAPRNPAALRIQAGCLFKLGRADEAWEACQTLLEVSPNAEPTLTLASLINLDRGDVPVALDFAKRALRLYPNSSMARAAHGNASLAAGDAEGAIEDFDVALQGEAPAVTRFNRAFALFHLERYREALTDLAELQLDEADGGLRRSQLGLRLRCLIHVDPARAELEAREQLARAPTRAEYAFLLGKALRRQGNPEARRWLEQALRLDPVAVWASEAARYLEQAR